MGILRLRRAACVALLASFVFFQVVRAATDVTITVTQGGVGVEGAFVALVGTGATKFAAVTDTTGKAIFSQVPDGSYVALASAPGTGAGSVAVVTPGETAKTITVLGSGTVFSPLTAFGAQTGAIVADGLSGVFYLNTTAIPSLYRTADHGGTWAPVTISSDDKTFGIDGSGTVTALTTSGFPGEVAALTSTGRLYYSSDFGVTWVSIPLPASNSTGSRLYWSHPASPGALSMLFFAPGNTASMYFASMPTATNTTAPTAFTQMGVSYRASSSDPVAIANGSDAGVVAVGATTTSSNPGRTAGDVTLYKVGAIPNGNGDSKLTINNGVVPGAVPALGTDGTSSLAATDLFLVRLGGPLSGPSIGGTTAPNTLIVYSVRSNDSASNAALTSCAGLICAATTLTTFKDMADVPTTSGSLTSATGTVACAASRSAGSVVGSVSPRGDAGSLGSCWLAKNAGSLDVRQVPNINNNTSMAFDAGFNGTSNNVLISGDGSKGSVKSARPGTTSGEGLNRPYFPPYPSSAAGGTAAASGGVAVNGINSGVVRDIAFNPSAPAQLASIMSFTGGGRVVGSADSGRTWFDLFGLGGDSLAWWNAGGGNQWLLAGAGSGGNLMAGTQITSLGFGASTPLTAIPNTTLTDLGITGGTTNVIVPAMEGITGTNMAIVSAARTNAGGPNAGYLEGSLALATLSSPGPTATISLLSGGKFTNAAPVSLAYCDGSAAASIADKMFVALASSSAAGTTGSVRIVANASQSSRSIQSLLGITGDFRVVRADCATGTVWAGRNMVSSSGSTPSGTRGLLKSTDGGGTFATITTTGRPDQILQKVQSLAIDPRTPSHVVVISTDNDIVETKDGGFTWTVLNDSTTARCPDTLVTPCGHTFGTPPSALELAPKAAAAGSPVTDALRASGLGEDALRASSQVSNDQAVVGSGAGLYAATTRTVQRAGLTFGGVVRGTEVLISGGQTVNLSFASSGVNWTASSDQPFVVVQPASGSGNGSFTVSINNTSGTAVQPGTYNATITIQTTGAFVSTQTITIAFTVVAASAPPIGFFDTPTDGSSGLQGSIPVSGWALDDIEIDRVELWRDRQAGETTPTYAADPADPRNGKIFISNATFVDGARPDVEAQYGAMPRAYRAGWGYLMLTWGLNNQGNGPFTFYAFAIDKEGTTSSIGTKTVNVNNTAANKPFGSIDTPGIGETISGTVANFGWGLTPKVNGVATCKIQSNGVQVSIDSGPLQPVVYGTVRPDIASAFAGFSNSAAAGGHYIIDTRLYANGAHTIGWAITDDCNRADGVGSRFFNIQNSSSSLTSAAPVAGPGVQMRVAEQVPDSDEAVTVAHGFGQLPAIVTPDSTGLRMARVKQGDRIEMRLPHGYDRAYQLMNGLDRPLPVGSSFDAASNTFYWQPAAGFLGSYELVFVRGLEQIRVRVFVDPGRNRESRNPNP